MNGTPWEEEIILCVDWEQMETEAEGIISGAGGQEPNSKGTSQNL